MRDGGAALGLVPHTGWAWLVRVGGTFAHPRIEARLRVEVCPVLAAELYHRASEHDGDAAAWLAHRTAAVEAHATEVFATHLDGVRAAVVLGKHAALPPLARILAAHPMIHTAEGEVWRAIVARACAAEGVTVTRATVDDVRASLTTRVGAPALTTFLAESHRVVGTPGAANRRTPRSRPGASC